MAEFTLTVTLTFPMTARNREKAEERADEVAESIKWLTAKWLGDIEIVTAVEAE